MGRGHWMLGSMPGTNPLVRREYDVRDEPRTPSSGDWLLAVSPGRVEPGDLFVVVYSHPDESFWAIGVFSRKVGRKGWIPVVIRAVQNPIPRRSLERLRAWQIKPKGSRRQVGYRKPFSRNADGTLNRQFGSPVALDLARWGSIWKRLDPTEQTWLHSESAKYRK